VRVYDLLRETKAGAPYLAFFWPDVGLTDAGAKVPVASENFQSESSYFPHLAKTGRDMGHPPSW
jgi:hypothetical protein